MTSTTADRHRPFSLDPAQWPRQWRAAAMLALDGPLLRSLRPASRVALRHAVDVFAQVQRQAGQVQHVLAAELFEHRQREEVVQHLLHLVVAEAVVAGIDRRVGGEAAQAAHQGHVVGRLARPQFLRAVRMAPQQLDR